MAEVVTPKWKISNYRPFGIIERDPAESTYEVGDDKFPFVASVHGDNLTQQRERAERIIRAVNSYDASQKKIAALVEALRRTEKLCQLLTVRQVVEGGNGYIEAAGLNPYCINEGLATGNEYIDVWFARAAVKSAEEE